MPNSNYLIPDLSDIKTSAVSCYLARGLGGALQKKPINTQRALSVLARLIDKVKFEYLSVREAVLDEENEWQLSFEEILQRNKGQLFYTVTIINNLEKCVNTISRIYKLISIIDENTSSAMKRPVIKIRNTIEHINERILKGSQGSLSLIFLNNSLVAEITGQQIDFVNLAGEIRALYEIIMGVLLDPK